MKKNIYRTLLCVFFAAGILFSCKKDDADSPSGPADPFPVPASSPVDGSVSGRIVDENDVPVIGATVTCAGIVTVTDENGLFNYRAITLDKYITTLTVSKNGYFKAYRSFAATASRNYINVQLIPKTLAGSFNGNSNGSISLSNGTTINFQPNSITVESSGVDYTGVVNVYAAYIDPTAENFQAFVPGNLVAKEDGKMLFLQSAGMLAVELESATGEKLQVNNSLPAAVTLPIPTSIVSKAPDSIATWSLDAQGVWAKESFALKNGNSYQFNASHFSFWNCDVPIQSTYLSLVVKDQNSNPIPNTLVRLDIINNTSFWASAYATTDANGVAAGIIPSGVQMQLRLYNPSATCVNNAFHTENIGPYFSNATTTITAQTTIQNSVMITGTAKDCNGQPLVSGTVRIFNGQYYQFTSLTNGIYSTIINYCNSTLGNVSIIVQDNNSTGQASTGSFALNSNTITVPPLNVCGAALNAFDGIYEVTGSFNDVFLGTAATARYPFQIHCVSIDDSTIHVLTDVNGALAPAFLFNNNGSTTFYGNFGLQVFFNHNDTTMAEVRNYYGDPNNLATGVGNPAIGTGAPDYAASNTSRAVLNPAGSNRFYPQSHNISISYYMLQPTVVPNGYRCSMEETWRYLGPR